MSKEEHKTLENKVRTRSYKTLVELYCYHRRINDNIKNRSSDNILCCKWKIT